MIGWLLAAQIAVVAHASDTATSCAPLEITVAARAAGSIAPRLAPPASPLLQLLRSSVTSHPEPDGAGRPFTVSEGTFVVALRGTGRIVLPGVVARIGAQHAASAPLVVTVAEPAPDDEDPRVLVRARLDDGRGRTESDSLFVGQQVDYVVDVQLNEAARRRLRRNPTFFPPDMPAVLAYDVEPPPPVVRSAPQCFETLTYRRALFPLFAGRTTIPPAVLTYAVPVSTSFFSREETRELRTDSVHIVATEPPVAGRPADYAGAVGTFHATARTDSTSVRMGDPLVVTLRIEGTGNVKLLPRPALAVDWASVAPAGERVEVDTAHASVTGAKEFDWLLTPRRAGRLEVPAIRYPYFDPARTSYDVAITDAIGLDVAAAALAASDTTAPPRLAIRATLRAEQRAPITDHPAYWALLALAPVPATLRRVRRTRRRAATALPAARRLDLAARRDEPMAARELRRLYLDAMRDRVRTLRPATTRLPLGRQLRRAGVTDTTADAAEALLEQLDSVAFSGGGILPPSTVADAARLTREIDAQAVRAMPAPVRTLAFLLVVGLGGAALLALPEGAARTFGEGVHAYDRGDLVLAERQFARVAQRAPRAVDGWANLGTAAWARSDTARAAAAWQRALRLDPLDADVRERLALARPGIEVGARGFVPPVSLLALAATALALWTLAWFVLALPVSRRRAALRQVAGGMIAVAIVALAATLELRDRLDPRGLGALRGTRALAESPRDGAPASATGAAGDVGLLGAREGSWVRIMLDGGRAGWVPTSAVLLLDDAASD